ncbi:MAG: peptide ABC transporter substrate-binding protein [Firmicutes bacterium]|nr:peptide ABC transporter substrate-binding protein [Bacillota bacterium]
MLKRLTLILLLPLIFMVFVACSNAPKTSSEQKFRLTTLKLAGGMDWGAPNPYLHDPRGPGVAKMKLIFDSLLEADENGIISWLAQDWFREGNVYTFILHEQARFHDGHPLTAADVAFTLDYYQQYPPVTNYLTIDGKSIVEKYEVLDERTISITVHKPMATTLTALGSFVILPKHIWEKVEDPYTYSAPEAFIGSGPYKFGDYEAATGSYEFLGHEQYYGAKAVAERLLFVPVSDPLLAFENGDIDLTEVPIDTMEKYKNAPGIGMIGKDNDMGYKLLINMETLNLFKDVKYRAAVYHALNRQEIVDKVFRGSGAVGSAGYVPPTNYFYNENVQKYDYNPEAAGALLREYELSLQLLAANTSDDVKIAELIKNDLAAVGVNVEVIAVDSKIRDEKVFDGEYELALVGNGGWGRTPDYLRTLYSSKSKFTGTNPHYMGPLGYDNERITELAEAQLFEMDFDKRKELLQELQAEISKEIPIVVVATKTTYVMFRKDYYDGWVKTYDYQQLEQNRLSYVEKQ